MEATQEAPALRPIPMDVVAEAAVLGNVLIDPKLMEMVKAILPDARAFYDDAHQTLYRHMLTVHTALKTIDEEMLVAQLRASGDLAAIGGCHYLGELVKDVVTTAHTVYYAELVRDKWLYRRIIQSAERLIAQAYDELEPPLSLARAFNPLPALAGAT